MRYLLQNAGPMPVYSMYPLAYINGHNFMHYYQNVMQLDGVTMRMGFGKHFVFNVLVQVGLIGIAWIGLGWFARKARYLKSKRAERTDRGME
jgi:hypothetical protein